MKNHPMVMVVYAKKFYQIYSTSVFICKYQELTGLQRVYEQNILSFKADGGIL